MPHLKLYLDDRHLPRQRDGLADLLHDLRAILCRALSEPPGACQLSVLPVIGLAGQAECCLELTYPPKESLTPETLRALAGQLQTTVIAATGLRATIWLKALDPQGDLALR